MGRTGFRCLCQDAGSPTTRFMVCRCTSRWIHWQLLNSRQCRTRVWYDMKFSLNPLERTTLIFQVYRMVTCVLQDNVKRTKFSNAYFFISTLFPEIDMSNIKKLSPGRILLTDGRTPWRAEGSSVSSNLYHNFMSSNQPQFIIMIAPPPPSPSHPHPIPPPPHTHTPHTHLVKKLRSRQKWPTFRRRHIEMHFLECKCTSFA